MNADEAVNRLAAANPMPPPAVQDAAASPRAELLLRTVLARPRPRNGVHRPRRWLLVPAAALTAAAAGAAVVLFPAAPEAPAPEPTAAAPSAILSAAARHAEQGPPPGRFRHAAGTVGRVVRMPSAGGYHVVLVDSVRSMQPADGQPGEGWVEGGEAGSSVRPAGAGDAAAYRADGSPGAARVAPHAGPSSFAALAGDRPFDGDVADLPDDPAETAAEMAAWASSTDDKSDDKSDDGPDDKPDDKSDDGPGKKSPSALDSSAPPADVQGWLFREGVRLLDTFTSVMRGTDRAKIYRMMTSLSGVRTLPAAADPLGRPAVGLAYTGATARYGTIDWQIFLGPGSDQIMYAQAVVQRAGPANATLAPGTVQSSTAVTGLRWTDKP